MLGTISKQFRLFSTTSKRFSHSTVNTTSRSVAVSRLMLPDHANLMGNVHGGVILQMLEEAGSIVSTQYCNENRPPGQEDAICTLARVERTNFLQPMKISNVAELHAGVSFTSKRSLRVQVNVFADDFFKGERRLTNTAYLWYVPVSRVSPTVLPVPPMEYSSPELEEKGRKAYDKQRQEREKSQSNGFDLPRQTGIYSGVPVTDAEPHTVAHSASSLIKLVGPSDCASHGFVMAGKTMKLMDECAALVSARHCRNMCVTISLDATNFHRKIRKGSILTVIGQVVYTGRRSLDVDVLVEAEEPFLLDGALQAERFIACEARFSFVPLKYDGSITNVPMLKVLTDEERRKYSEGEKRREERKKKKKMAPL